MNKSISAIMSIVILMIAAVLAASSASADNFGYTPGVEVVYLEINGYPVSDNEDIRINFERDQELEVKLKFYSYVNLTDVEASAYITGYKYNTGSDRMSDVKYFPKMEAGVEYPVQLKIKLSQLVETDDYKLRVSIADRYSSLATFNFNLQIDAPENELKIKDIILSPSDEVKAGRSLIANVRVQNIGAFAEEDIKVKAEVKSLGISAIDYIDRIETDRSKTSEDLLLRIPVDAKPGIYTMKVTVTYNNDYSKIVDEVDFEVVEGDVPATICITCGTTAPAANDTAPSQPTTPTTPATDGSVLINYDSNSKVLTQGEGGAIYSITISNNGATARSFVVDASGINWATVRISPGNVVVVEPGQSKAVYIYVSANENAAIGAQEFSAVIKSGNDVVGTATFKADVVEASGSFDKVTFNSILTYLLIALVIVLVLVVIVLVVTKNKDKEKPEEEEFDATQSYY